MNTRSQEERQTAPYVYPQDWPSLLQRLIMTETALQRVTNQVAGMQKRIDELSAKQPVHIEYHFDQLKVNRLEGTLNVGISPQGIQDIEQLSTPDPSCFQVNSVPSDNANEKDEPPDELIKDLQRTALEEMGANGESALLEMERQFEYPLGAEHRRRVVEDVENQVGGRVHYYARKTKYPASGTDEEKRKWREDVLGKTRADVKAAFSDYLNKQKRQQPSAAQPQRR
ncbi:spore germination protein GerPC [Cohnella suwonensis]|uniref:Spore germination protein GerPC n=1 Tax=Cohnella suwonensis TaxID=696072 RepID=A0ABW0LQ45_9BACL